MEWVSNPAWWALAVSIIGTAVNAVWNWLNWRANNKPVYSFEIFQSPEATSRPIFLLKNTGNRTVTGVWFDFAELASPAESMVSISWENIPGWNTIRPGEYRSFELWPKGCTSDGLAVYNSVLRVGFDQSPTPVEVFVKRLR